MYLDPGVHALAWMDNPDFLTADPVELSSPLGVGFNPSATVLVTALAALVLLLATTVGFWY